MADTNDRERANDAFDAARAAHELEVLLRSLAESLCRGEAPDAITAGFIPGARARLNALIALAMPADGDAP